MSMSAGSSGSGSGISEINVTPMIDVLLVLLIIFMVIQPMAQVGIDLNVPPDDDTPQKADPQIVLQVEKDGYKINTQPVAKNGLGARLQELYTNRPEKIIMVKGGEGVTYGDVIEAMDIARGAGIKIIGIVPKG